MMQSDISTKILFSTVTATLDRIQSTNGHQKKVSILNGYFDKFATFRASFVTSNVDCVIKRLAVLTSRSKQKIKKKHFTFQYSSIYPVLRLIIPKKDQDRDKYGIQMNTIGQIYVRILGVQKKSDVAIRLTAKCSSKDYPDVVYEVMKNRCSNVGKLTVYEVNRHLDAIASCYKNNQRKSKFFFGALHPITFIAQSFQKSMRKLSR